MEDSRISLFKFKWRLVQRVCREEGETLSGKRIGGEELMNKETKVQYFNEEKTFV